MSTQTFVLPDVGEGLPEAEIVQWRVAPGDAVAVNDVLVEIETAKSLVELPSPFAGTVGELLVAEGDTIDVGAPIITIASGAGADASSPATVGQSEHGAPAEPQARARPRGRARRGLAQRTGRRGDPRRRHEARVAGERVPQHRDARVG